MTIAVPVEIDNLKIKDFTEAEREVYRVALEFGRTLMRQILETRDLQILTERDGERYRNKGLRTTCIKTVMGEVVYDRRVYQDLEAQDEKKHGFQNVKDLGLLWTRIFAKWQNYPLDRADLIPEQE